MAYELFVPTAKILVIDCLTKINSEPGDLV
jgi:hypothetical protein